MIHRLLLLYEHVITCLSEEEKCKLPSFMVMKQKVRYIFNCNNSHCTTQCDKYKKLFDHYRGFHESLCGICSSIRMRLKNVSQGAITVTQTACPTVDTVDMSISHLHGFSKASKLVGLFFKKISTHLSSTSPTNLTLFLKNLEVFRLIHVLYLRIL